LHGIDEDRFYAFVDSAWRQFGEPWDEKAARDQVTQLSHVLDPDLSDDDRMRVINCRLSQADTILKFLAYKTGIQSS